MEATLTSHPTPGMGSLGIIDEEDNDDGKQEHANFNFDFGKK